MCPGCYHQRLQRFARLQGLNEKDTELEGRLAEKDAEIAELRVQVAALARAVERME